MSTSTQGLLVVVLICLLKVLSALPSGGVSFNCDGRLPSLPRYGSGGYKLHIEGSPSHYQPNRLYTVTLLSSQRQSFRAFHISVKSEETNESVGQFQAFNNFTSKLQDKCSVSNMVNKHLGKKTYVRVKWMSPASRSGCILLQAAVHEKGSKWYRAEGDLVTRICEKDINAPPIDSCCACGTATYRMKFYGIWSPQSHPRDYPKYSTHWSNVVGASHTPLYTIWQYGEKASDAVQQIAEWGFPEKMMHELRAQGEDVLTVVKTRAQWPAWPANGKFIPLVSNFDVDNRRFLVSLLTMLGPSPDWNVGISKESMCLSSCGWVGKREYFLTPWDAGTDDGVSYNSPNKPANPHHPIRPLNSTDHPDSPFYDVTGAAISPLARMVIERVRIEGEQCGESEESSASSDFDEGDDDFTEVDGQSGRRCMYSEWFDWQPCSVSCGWGLKNRKRMVKVGKPMMCTDVMQTEICLGSGNCDNNENVTTCIYSEWTSWSRCSASCGESVRSRQRVMKWPSEPSFCDAPLKELVQCQLPSCDEACMYTPWSEWMICNATCGVGTTLRKRGLKIGNPEMCTKVMERSECMTSMSCHADARFDVATCSYGRWSEWSPCPVECGAGQTFRKRMLLNATAIDGEGTNRCESFQMESSKCMTSVTCDASVNDGFDDDDDRCELGDWSSWSTCSVTCGMGIVMRQRVARDPRGEVECSRHEIEKEICNPTPTCEETCLYQEWMEWMPCSVSCGSGWTVRKRFADASANNNGDCESFQMEKNRCLVPCPIEEEEEPDHEESREEVQVAPSLPSAILTTTTTSEPEALVETTAASPMTTMTSLKLVTETGEKEEENIQVVYQEDLEVVDQVKPVVVVLETLEAVNQNDSVVAIREESIKVEREDPVAFEQKYPEEIKQEEPVVIEQEEEGPVNQKEPVADTTEEPKAVEEEESLVIEQEEEETINQEESKLAGGVVEEVTTPEVHATEEEEKEELLIKSEPATTDATTTTVGEAEGEPQTETTMCTASPWQEWSACSITCGFGGHMTRSRSDPDAPGCHMSETRSCGGIRRCPIDCQEGDWSAWRSCAKACSKNPFTKALTYRRRVLKRPKFGGKACGPRKEVRRCTC